MQMKTEFTDGTIQFLTLMILLEHLDLAVPEAIILLDFSVPRVNWFPLGLKLYGIRGLSLAIMRS